jgi:hypothetical protein
VKGPRFRNPGGSDRWRIRRVALPGIIIYVTCTSLLGLSRSVFWVFTLILRRSGAVRITIAAAFDEDLGQSQGIGDTVEHILAH